jgi:hypothetical protein
MLADNTTCQQLVFRDVNQAGKLVAQHFKYFWVVGIGNGSGRFQIK